MQQWRAELRLEGSADTSHRRDENERIDNLDSLARDERASCVPEARPGHYRERHSHERAPGPCVDAGARRQPAEGSGADENEPERHEGEGDVEDENQRLPPGPLARPPGE